jgi:ZIP family zinc transporter
MSPTGFALTITTLAGASTLVGGLVFLLFRQIRRPQLSFFMGLSAGAMLFVSLAELLPHAVETAGDTAGYLAFFVGIGLMAVIDFLLPHNYMGEEVGSDESRRLLTMGTLTAIGIGIHNFPEGISVFLSALGDPQLGIALAIAIAAHNIPEGVAVAIPIFAATGSRARAFWYTFLAGAAEPVGAVLALLFLARYITPDILGLVFALIAGIMVFISFDELLPCCFRHRQGHTAIVGLTAGMALVAFSLHWLG